MKTFALGYLMVPSNYWLRPKLQHHGFGGWKCAIAFFPTLLVSHGIFLLLTVCLTVISYCVFLSAIANTVASQKSPRLDACMCTCRGILMTAIFCWSFRSKAERVHCAGENWLSSLPVLGVGSLLK